LLRLASNSDNSVFNTFQKRKMILHSSAR